MKPDKRLSRRGGKVQFERTFPMKNTINWFEIPVSDITKAAALYSAMLDQKLQIADFGGEPHAVFPHGDNIVSGALVGDRKRSSGKGVTIYLNASDGLA